MLFLNKGILNYNSSNYIVKEFIARRVVDSSTDEAAIYNYLKTKYGL
jgi:hypothetical protein